MPWRHNKNSPSHYTDVIMTTIASQITSLTVVYSTVYSDADQSKHQSSASLAFVWRSHRDRWIPHTKGQLRGKWFHLMTSSWNDHTVSVCFSGNYSHLWICESYLSTPPAFKFLTDIMIVAWLPSHNLSEPYYRLLNHLNSIKTSETESIPYINRIMHFLLIHIFSKLCMRNLAN